MRQQARCGAAQFAAAFESRKRQIVVSFEHRLDIVILIFRTPESVAHRKRPGLSEPLVPDKICGAKCGAVIGGCRLNVNLLERRLRADFAIRDAVHRAAARKAKALGFRPLPKAVENMKRAGLIYGLQRVSDVFVELS